MEEDLLEPGWSDWSHTFRRRALGFVGRWRGRSRDRLDALGEAFFEEFLRPRLRPEGIARVLETSARSSASVLESRGLDHVVAPLARHLGVDRVLSERLEFRDGIATGRSLPRAATPWSMTEIARRTHSAVLVDDSMVAPLSVRETLAGRHLFVIGGTGFIGKVWLASLLRDAVGLDRITILLRRRGNRDARSRFDRVVASSPVFEGLQEEAARRIEVVEGDVTRDQLGLPSSTLASLRTSVDLIVNCAGLTDFNPDLREALAINVEGVLRVIQFQRSCDHAALLHVSTCFVAGRREGRVREEIRSHETPTCRDFDAEREHAVLHELAARVAAESDGGPRAVRKRLVEESLARADELGWPNIYTFTKGLGEALLEQRGRGLPIAVVRPSIVESALRSPSRGWNEGINTSAPLSYLLGTFFRQLPVNQRKRLDVIPVDLVARGLTLVSTALIRRRAARVYQLATSAENPLDLRRAVELTALAHRKHYRRTPGWRSRILARLEAVPVSRERYGRFSVPAQLEFVRGINRVWGAVLRHKSPLARLEQVLARVKELVDLYDPFLLDNEPVFEADHIALLDAALPAAEREAFGYDPLSFDWYDYWIHVHIPGLRQWSYPLLEGRPVARPGKPADALTGLAARDDELAATPSSARES